ncbi:MAG: IS4 family transposase [Chloroflexota bacterium]|nr:IS4 family transposase [Chloroflexota bacterium]
MSYDTPGQHPLPRLENPHTMMEGVLIQAVEAPRATSMVSKRGRPARLSEPLLAAGILWCVLHGWVSQWDLWRRVSGFGIGSLAPVPVCDQAVYNRLARQGTDLMESLCAQITTWLWEWLAPYEDRRLAPFACGIYALDESTMDALHRWLRELRDVPLGDPSLLAGRLVGLFDVRRQQWVRLEWLPKAIANCQLMAQQMISDLPKNSMVLFDLGYYNFEWFDTLTRRGIWWVARLRRNGSYTIEHFFVSRDGYVDALIFLGAHRADRTASLMRLVRVRYQGRWYSYLSNVTDPLRLSGADIVALYARRWDIELGFRMLKDHLGLRFLWSAKMQVIGAQLWAIVILAQMLHALQVQVAVESGVQTFDVSLEVLWRYWPDLSQQARTSGRTLTETIREIGPSLGLIRPSTRLRRLVPQIDWQELTPVPIDLVWIRPPRYAKKAHGSPSRAHSGRKKAQTKKTRTKKAQTSASGSRSRTKKAAMAN